MLAHLLLTFQHRAGVRPYTSSFDFAESCVFDKQSLPPILCHHPKVALKVVPLLPKLQGQFAEFLQHHSLKRLNIFYMSTCVGLGYGLYVEVISWKSSAAHKIHLSCTTLTLRHSSTGHGILTVFPSTTPFGLVLGADSPIAD